MVCTRSPHSLTSSAWISCCLGRDFFLWWWWWWCLWLIIKLVFFASIWFSRRTCSFLCLLRFDSVLRDDSIWIGQAMPEGKYGFSVVALFINWAAFTIHEVVIDPVSYAVIKQRKSGIIAVGRSGPIVSKRSLCGLLKRSHFVDRPKVTWRKRDKTSEQYVCPEWNTALRRELVKRRR